MGVPGTETGLTTAPAVSVRNTRLKEDRTVTLAVEIVDIEPATVRPCEMVDESWETPCPMTGTNACPSDPAKQAKCSQC